MRILILDNDDIQSKNLMYSMKQDDYDVDIICDPELALLKLGKGYYDILIVETEINNAAGLSLIQSVRRMSDMPIVVLSSNTEDINKILSLEYGADDYLAKPCNILELKVRIKSILRRLRIADRETKEQEIIFDDYHVKTVGRILVKGEEVISLTGKEFDLLYVLSSNPGKVFSREELMTTVWGYQYFGDLRSIDVHIRRIREKIEPDCKNPKYILTKWGVGYFFCIPDLL